MNVVDFVVGRPNAATGPNDSSRRSQKIGGEPPEWIRIFPDGEYECEDGTYICDAESRTLCLDYFEQRGNDLVVDYEHATLEGTEAPAAGWITELDDRGDAGLWARVDWTTRAADYLRAGEYRYYSPVFLIDPKTKRVVKLYHLALTNWPGSNDMTALTEQIAASVRARQVRKQSNREGGMNIFENVKWWLNLKTTTTNNELRVELQKLMEAIPADDNMAIAEKAGDATTIAEAAGYVEKASVAATDAAAPSVVANKTLLDELELPETATLAQTHARIGELKTRTSPEDVDKMREDLKTMSARVKELEAKSDDEKLKLLFETNRNKVTPAKEKWLRTVAQKNGYDHVMAIVKELKEELPTTASGAEPKIDDAVPVVAERAPDGRRVNQKAAERHAKVMKLAAEKKLTYDAANEELRSQEAIAAVK
jgi:phage I-like protein